MGIETAIIGGSVASGLLGASSAKSAAKAQTKAADAQAQVQREMYEQTREDLSPWRESGQTANQAANAMLGLGAAPTVDGQQWSFETSPGYTFNLQQGMNALDASAATRGGLLSGATLKAAQEYGAGLASNEYWNTYNALAGQSTVGQNAAAQTGSAAGQAASGISNALANAGNATAAGYTGTANALSGAMGNALGAYQYSTLLNKLGTA